MTTRWNTKGTSHAKVRMAELRHAKAKKTHELLRWEYCTRHGINPFDGDAFQSAKVAAGLPAFERGGVYSPEYLAFLQT